MFSHFADSTNTVSAAIVTTIVNILLVVADQGFLDHVLSAFSLTRPHTHSHIVLPVHPPEINDSVWQWTLSCDVGLWAVHTLKTMRPKRNEIIYQ